MLYYYVKNRKCWICHGHKKISNDFIKSLDNIPCDENGIAYNMIMCKNCGMNLCKWMNNKK